MKLAYQGIRMLLLELIVLDHLKGACQQRKYYLASSALHPFPHQLVPGILMASCQFFSLLVPLGTALNLISVKFAFLVFTGVNIDLIGGLPLYFNSSGINFLGGYSIDVTADMHETKNA